MKKFLKYSWMLVLPAVVAAAVIWKSSAAEPSGSCPEVNPLDHTVLLPVPGNCSAFYSCSDGVPILMHCPDGLHFNDELDVCDWPQDAGCEGTCGWGVMFYDDEGFNWRSDCNVPKDEAVKKAAQHGGNWCCDSCKDTWYCTNYVK